MPTSLSLCLREPTQGTDPCNDVCGLVRWCRRTFTRLGQAGFMGRFSLDTDPWFLATYRYNRPHLDASRSVVCADIREWMGDDPEPVPVDLLVGGVPCQPFSNANRQRQRHDPRRNLFVSFFDSIPTFAPKALVIENVSGFRTHVDEVMDLFEDAGFVAAEYDLDVSQTSGCRRAGDASCTSPFPRSLHRRRRIA